MTMQINHQVKSEGALSLTLEGENKGPWTLFFYLKLHGKPLYLIGNVCYTCEALFKRVDKAHLPLTPQQLSNKLKIGLSTVSQDFIDTVGALLPKGNYQIELITMKPLLIAGQKPPINVSCEADYYWLDNYEWTPTRIDYDLILPIVPRSDINGNRVAYYKAIFKDGMEPTALAFSIQDIRYAHGRFGQAVIAHFLLDGHHKVMAASQMSRSITILSFLWKDKVVDLYKEKFPRS